MATLENRSGGSRRYVATAWYSSPNDSDMTHEGVRSVSARDANGLRTVELSFVYGRLHKGADPLPDGVEQGGADEPVTHVNVVFASSRRGDHFEGTKGARLVVKDFEFLY